MNINSRSKMRSRSILTIAVTVAGLVFLGACTVNSAKKSESGAAIAASRVNYVPVNDVEGRNYNARLRLADSPATLIWCTAYPQSPNAKAFTVPIVGKLTSGNKRPTPGLVTERGQDNRAYNPELPGPDGFFGTSGEYRYGFDPAGNYHDFYNLETYCTSVPNVVQKEQTIIIIGVAGDLGAADTRAQAALKACVEKAGKNPDGTPKFDPSQGCPEAARALGIGG